MSRILEDIVVDELTITLGDREIARKALAERQESKLKKTTEIIEMLNG